MQHSAEQKPARRDDLDWLRVFATYLLFVFHVAMVFNPAPFYHIRNGELSFAMLVVAGFISLWHMPLFFLLAGWSIHASLRSRGGAVFLKERVLKLFIPLVMGCLLLMPPIKYIELLGGLDLNHRGLRVSAELQDGFRSVIPQGLPLAQPFDESFWEFLPTFYTQLDRFTWAHLWFLAYLFAFTLLYYPLFRWLGRTPERFADASSKLVYAPAVVLAAIQLTLRPGWPGIQNLYDDWANFAFYSTVLVSGFLLARFPGLERAAQREWRRALAVGVGVTLVLLLALLGVIRSPSILLAGSGVATWCFLLALLGFARRHLSRGARALPYLAESAFPVYVLHQSAIVLIGYPLLQLPLGIAAKYVLLLIASLSATLAVYHFAVRRFASTRFLFGMKADVSMGTPRVRVAYTSLAVLLAAVVPNALWASASPVGLWYAEGGAAQIEIYPCAEGLCGRVAWVRAPFDEDGCEWRDRHNDAAELRERPIVGLEVLRGLRAGVDGAGVWTGGTIYDPTSGATYRAHMRLESGDRLQVRGYWGIALLGRTTTWIRVGSEARACAATGGDARDRAGPHALDASSH